jgi:type VI secretion system protein ImpA
VTTDIDAILTPIQGPDPGGSDLRYDPVHDRIKELRREDDPRASRGIWLTKLKVADWTGAAELCAEVLAERSKDLQLVCWLVDAIVARDGLRCLPAELHRIAGFCDAFWPVLWPRPTQDDEEDPRQVVFSWLDSRLSERAMRTRIAVHGDVEASWQDYVYAQRAAFAVERKPARRGATGTSELDTAAIDSAIEHTADAYYADLARDVAAGLAAVEQLKTVLDRHFNGRGPSFSRSLGALIAIVTFLRPQLLRRRITTGGIEGPPVRPKESTTMTEMPPDVGVLLQAPVIGAIRTRDEVYRTLDAAACFLEQTEPHSPVSLLIRRAIAWGGMPLPALLGEMMRDQALTYRLLGIEEEAPAGSRGRQ